MCKEKDALEQSLSIIYLNISSLIVIFVHHRNWTENERIIICAPHSSRNTFKERFGMYLVESILSLSGFRHLIFLPWYVHMSLSFCTSAKVQRKRMQKLNDQKNIMNEHISNDIFRIIT